VSDAGTPGVSDPAAALARAAREKGVPVLPIPGPSAVTALLSVAGFEGAAFVFRGFLPRKSSERRSEMTGALDRAGGAPVVWFESPERIMDSVADAVAVGEGRAVEFFAAKEMTKVHERHFFGGPSQVAHLLKSATEADAGALKGEWCLALREPLRDQGLTAEGPALVAVRLLVEAGIPVSEAARRCADAFKIAKKPLYQAALLIASELEKNQSGS
jgi:16S rRNA (cytidine1402-2'-O)-methyltransferase